MEKAVVRGLSEAWLSVAKKIKVSEKAAHAKGSLLESLAYVLRDKSVSSLDEVPRLIGRVFQDE
jgi:hypothetical protein